MSDPENPIAKVREAHVTFTVIYKGENAWNQNELVAKLQNDLTKTGWSVRSWHLDSAYDKDGKRITENEMREYVYRKHGHDGLHGCSSCPDPLKWKEVEKLKLKAYYEDKERWKDESPPSGYNWATGEVQKGRRIYILETQEERDKRLKAIEPPKKKSNKNGNNSTNITKKEETRKEEPDFDFEPKLQF